MKEAWLWEVSWGLFSFSDLCFYRLSIKYIRIGHNDNIQILWQEEFCREGEHMKEENIITFTTENEETSNTVVTKQAVESMTQGELLGLLKAYEGPGRTLRFQEQAMTQEKKEQGIPYKFAFSWSWLTVQASEKGLVYGEDGHWKAEKQLVHMKNDVIIVRNVENKRKRTVEASEEAFADFDALARRLPISKALLMTEAIQRFAEDVEAGRIGFEYRLR